MKIEALIGDAFRGCVYLKHHNQILFQRGYGYSDLSRMTPNEPITRFSTASASAVFLAVAILRLVEDDRLQLDSTLSSLMSLDWQKIDPEITVEQLLTHTAGVPDYSEEFVLREYEENWSDCLKYAVRTSAELLPLFSNKEMLHPRGSKFQYSNTSYVLLTLVLESIVILTFDLNIRRRVFNTCAMSRTGYFALDRLPSRCATHYVPIASTKNGAQYRANIFCADAKGTGGGGAYTTAGDLALFWEALLSYKLLSPQMTERMLENHSGEAGGFGYGVWLDKGANRDLVSIHGNAPGASCFSCCDRKNDMVLVLMSNFGDPVLPLADEIIAQFQKGDLIC